MRHIVYSDFKLFAVLGAAMLLLVALTGAGENGALAIIAGLVGVGVLVRMRLEDRDARGR